MPQIDRGNLLDLLVALGIVAAGMLLWSLLFATPAQAQLAVSDAPVEASTADMDTVQLPGILKQNTASALSLTTTGGAGRFQPQAAYLNSLMQTMTSGVADAASFAALYPGWVDFGPDAADVAAQITNATLTTYANAITVAQSQAADFNAEDAQFEKLEACNAASIGVMQAIQCGNEINLAAAQQTQLLRQIEITRLIVEAVHDGEELNERAQHGANSQAYFMAGAQH